MSASSPPPSAAPVNRTGEALTLSSRRFWLNYLGLQLRPLQPQQTRLDIPCRSRQRDQDFHLGG
jgi:hypothetical protein